MKKYLISLVVIGLLFSIKVGFCQTPIKLCPTSNGINFCDQLHELINNVEDSDSISNSPTNKYQSMITQLKRLNRLINVDSKINTDKYNEIIIVCDSLSRSEVGLSGFDKRGTVNEIRRLIRQNNDAGEAENSSNDLATDTASKTDKMNTIEQPSQRTNDVRKVESTDQLTALNQRVILLERNNESFSIWNYVLIATSVILIIFIIICILRYQKINKSIDSISQKLKDFSVLNNGFRTNNQASNKSNYLENQPENDRINKQESQINQLKNEIDSLKIVMEKLQHKNAVRKSHESDPIIGITSAEERRESKIYYHAKFEPSKNGFEIEGNHCFEQENNRTKYRITAMGPEAELDFIHSEQNTAALSELGQKFLFPLFDVVSAGFDTMKVWRAKKPAKLRKEGNYWVIEKKGEI